MTQGVSTAALGEPPPSARCSAARISVPRSSLVVPALPFQLGVWGQSIPGLSVPRSIALHTKAQIQCHGRA